ncbi:hypothetical protein JTE90_011566 [Oedothorax gibbosus]|uniref:Ig-like domain-containing protein n=1 Tax=Oedothorax gibbosus TaxID=931172 RepID=A0AAV6UKV3_9ARAC|nr:hypothetical protein JTE90_011566 [Oedothorax gibbosus]
MRLHRLEVPGAVVIGENVWLKCDFDLEGDELYSVKWYKNNVEFYRFQPRDRLHGQMYELLGVYVELKRSNASHVFLRSSDLNTEGTYGCEVSSEAPHFKTVKAEDELRVYVLPKEPPVIEGADSMYEVGDRVNITCNSGPSKPAATLSWYINGVQANATFVRKYSSIRHYSGLQTSQVGLEFVVGSKDFDHGKLKLRCVATISQVYSSGSEELIIGDRGQASGSHHAVPYLIPGQDGPKIEGTSTRYEIGDLVDVNCTSAPARSAALLKWFINDKEVAANKTTPHPPIQYTEELKATVLGLRFRVEQTMFKSDELRLKCTATLSRVVSLSSDVTVVGGNQQNSGFHVSENTVSVTNPTPRCCVERTLWISILLTILSAWYPGDLCSGLLLSSAY